MAGDAEFVIHAERLELRPWTEADRETLIAMYADPGASRDFGRPLRREESEATFEKYLAAFPELGFTRWKVTLPDGTFIGTNGVMRQVDHQCLGTHDEIGWRMLPQFWGKGYATEAARASLRDAHERCGLRGLITYTAPDNLASQAVMARMGFIRDEGRNFTTQYDTTGEWHGWVWDVPNPA